LSQIKENNYFDTSSTTNDLFNNNNILLIKNKRTNSPGMFNGYKLENPLDVNDILEQNFSLKDNVYKEYDSSNDTSNNSSIRIDISNISNTNDENDI